MPEEEIEVVRNDGEVGTIPISDLYKALQSGAYQLVNPNQEISVINSQGEEGDIPATDWMKAMDSGEYSYSSAKQEPQGDDWPALISKSLVSGALSFADLPVVLAGLGEMGIDYAKGNEIQPPKSFEHLPSSYLKKGIKGVTGVNLEPRPTTGAQRIVSGILEGGAGAATGAGLASKVAKSAATNATKNLAKIALASNGVSNTLGNEAKLGAAVGGTSQVAQEMGANPVVGGLVGGIGAPVAIGTGTATKNLFSSFLPKNRAAKKFQKAAALPIPLEVKQQGLLNRFTPKNRALRKAHEKASEAHNQELLKKLESENLLDIEPTAAELAENPGISALYKEFRDRSALIQDKEALNDKKIRDITNSLYSELKKIRNASAKPLFNKVVKTDDIHNFPSLQAFLEDQSHNADSVQSGWINNVKNRFGDQLNIPENPKTKSKIAPELAWMHPEVATNHATTSYSAPLGLAENVRKNLYRESKKGTDKVPSGFYGKAADALTEDIARTDAGLAHIKDYASKSTPLNFMELHPEIQGLLDNKRSPLSSPFPGKNSKATKNSNPYMGYSPEVLDALFNTNTSKVNDLNTILARRTKRDNTPRKMSQGISDPSFVENAVDIGGSAFKAGSKLPFSPLKYLNKPTNYINGLRDLNIEQALLNPSFASELLQYKPPKPQWSNVSAIGQGLKGAGNAENRRRKIPRITVSNPNNWQ